VPQQPENPIAAIIAAKLNRERIVSSPFENWVCRCQYVLVATGPQHQHFSTGSTESIRELKSVLGCPRVRITDKSLFVQRIAIIEEIGTLSTTQRFLSIQGRYRFAGRNKLPTAATKPHHSDSNRSVKASDAEFPNSALPTP
jgi:hypothetical protein